MKRIKNIALIVLLLVVTLFVFRCSNNFPSLFNGEVQNTTDTIRVIDTFYIKKDPIVVIDSFPKYIVNVKYTDSITNIYKDSINNLKDEKDRIHYLLQQLSVKEYDSTYYFGLSSVNVKEKISGNLISRKLTYYPYNTVINNTTTITNKYYPNYAWSIGGEIGLLNMGINRSSNAILGGLIEYKNSKGLQYQLGYSGLIGSDTNAYILKIGVLKEIFVNYKK